MNHYTNQQLAPYYKTVSLAVTHLVQDKWFRNKQLGAIDRRVRAIGQCETSIADYFGEQHTLRGFKLPGFKKPITPDERVKLEGILEFGPQEAIAEIMRRREEDMLRDKLHGGKFERAAYLEELAESD